MMVTSILLFFDFNTDTSLEGRNIMTVPTFTTKQVEHASSVVIGLMKNRRFFLKQPVLGTFSKPGHNLDPKTFAEAIELDAEIRQVYVNKQDETTTSLLDLEKNIGLKPPSLRNNQQIVQCNLYTGGLDICSVWPLTWFMELMPDSQNALYTERKTSLIGGVSVDNFSKKQMDSIHNTVTHYANRVWNELEELLEYNRNENRCVMLMQTRFSATMEGAVNGDLLCGKTDGLRNYPLAIGHLFLKRSLIKKIVHNNFVLFDSNKSGHTVMSHMPSKDPYLSTQDCGYACKTYFATVL